MGIALSTRVIGVAMESFMELLDEYIRFYNERRKKQSLDWMSPMQHRRSLEWSGYDELDTKLRAKGVQDDPRKSGIAVSEKRALRTMRKLGLAGRGAARKHRIRKRVEPGDPRSNLVERAFTVGGRNRLWAGGIACMPAREGRLYLAAATGAFPRKAVGWSMSGRITGKVAIDAIGRAVGREGPPDDGSLVFHGDQGARRASRSFRRCPGSHGIVQSVSRPGTPLDSAVAESFFKTLKGESAEGRSYGTRDEAKQDIFKYIELHCNRARMHPALDCMSPVEYERQYA